MRRYCFCYLPKLYPGLELQLPILARWPTPLRTFILKIAQDDLDQNNKPGGLLATGKEEK
jgi:hypothetical protein